MDANTPIETFVQALDLPVRATIGFLYKIRLSNGFYEAKVASVSTPAWWSKGVYLLGEDVDVSGRSQGVGAWIPFGDNAEMVASQWQPRVGDRVVVFTFGNMGYQNGRLFRLATTYDSGAQMASGMQINGPLRILGG